MATIFKAKDVSALMNALARQATGQADISVVDHQSFIDAGSKTLDTGLDNVMNSIYIVLNKLYAFNRKYTGKINLISESVEAYNTMIAKIDTYSTDNDAVSAFNTDKNTNIGNGLSDIDGTGSQWEQKVPKVVERFFHVEAGFMKWRTTFVAQLQAAFNDESAFTAFWNMIVTEYENDLESTIESRNRAVIADRIAGTKLMVDAGHLGKECAVNLTELVNKEFGTQYTTKQILESHMEELLKVYVAKVKLDSDRLTERSALYHDPMTITDGDVNYNVLRFTPKANQKFIYDTELFTKAKANVMPEIFNPSYLDEKKGEGVTYWQSNKEGDRTKIKATPALPAEYKADVKAVELDNVVGMLFDDAALMTTNQFQGVYTTPVNARKLYYNTFNHYKFGVINDYSHNTIIYYMAD